VKLLAETFAGKLLERMIPSYGTIVKLIFRMCVFPETLSRGYGRIAVRYNSREENCTFGPKTAISAYAMAFKISSTT